MAGEDDLQAVAQDLLMEPLVSIPIVPEIPEEEESSTDEIDTKFDPRYREPFVGLLYLGHLSETVTKYGHTFELETPSQRERLEAGILHKRFVNTISGEIGWAAIVVGLYLRSVDGQDLPEPIGPAAETRVAERYNWVIDNVRGQIINDLFNECLLLDAKVDEVLDELESQGN